MTLNIANDTVRDQILADPRAVLDDRDLMKALISADEGLAGSKVIDLRSIALERLETRLDKLEDTHRSVIAAAYDNLHGTAQIHRAVLDVLAPKTFDDFLAFLANDLKDILKVNALCLCFESPAVSPSSGLDSPLGHAHALTFFAPDEIGAYVSDGREILTRKVILRETLTASPRLFGEEAFMIRSEALMLMDLGEGKLPGMLALGSTDPNFFDPAKATDLLTFFAGVFERTMQRWIG